MEKTKINSTYATNNGGFIKAPKPLKKDVRASVTKGNDLRVKGNK